MKRDEGRLRKGRESGKCKKEGRWGWVGQALTAACCHAQAGPGGLTPSRSSTLASRGRGNSLYLRRQAGPEAWPPPAPTSGPHLLLCSSSACSSLSSWRPEARLSSSIGAPVSTVFTDARPGRTPRKEGGFLLERHKIFSQIPNNTL